MANPWDEAPIVQPAGAKTPAANPWDDAPIVQPATKESRLGGVGNFIYGAAKGAADLVQAPAQLAVNAAGFLADKVSPDSDTSKYINDKANQFNQYLTNQENQYQEETPGSVPAGIGRFVSNALPFAMTGGGSAAPAAAGIGSKAMALAKVLGQSGGLTALTQPINNATTDNFMGEKALQAGIGAAGGALGAGIGNIAGRVISPKLSADATAAMKEGITPTIGQMYGGKAAKLENLSSSLPFIGNLIKDAQRSTTHDLNRAAYNRALNPIGQNANDIPLGNEGVLAVKTALGDAYDKLLPGLQFKGDKQFEGELIKITGMVNNGSVPPGVSAQFNAILKNNVLNKMTPQGNMSGTTMKEIQTDVGAKARGFRNSQDPNQRDLGNALDEVLNSMRENITRSNPDKAAELSAINKGYANYKIISEAAKSPATENGVFTPAQLARAVYNKDKSFDKVKSATGKALMQDLAQTGKSIAPTFPNSGTADRIGLPAMLASAIAAPASTAVGITAGLAGSLPYTQAGKKIASTILARRPEGAPALANSVRKGAIPLGAVLGAYTPQLLNGGQ